VGGTYFGRFLSSRSGGMGGAVTQKRSLCRAVKRKPGHSCEGTGTNIRGKWCKWGGRGGEAKKSAPKEGEGKRAMVNIGLEGFGEGGGTILFKEARGTVWYQRAEAEER